MNEAELLFTDILNCDRMSLYANKDLSLDKVKSSLVSAALKRRIQGEPIQYILGKAEFMGLDFRVTPDVLIPRPETEILVETALKIVRMFKCLNVKMLDIGTGSGCIAISLAKFLKNIKVTATDISNVALEIANQNALFNNVKINFLQADLFADYRLPVTDYDVIVSNPPYVPTQEIDTLQPEIKYEPRLALDGGEDGLNFYRRIIHGAPRYLKKSGFLIMETGFGQKDAIKNIFQKSGAFKIIEWVKDYNNIDRVVVAKKER